MFVETPNSVRGEANYKVGNKMDMPFSAFFPALCSAAQELLTACADLDCGEPCQSAVGQWHGSYIDDTLPYPRAFAAAVCSVPFGEANLYGEITTGASAQARQGVLVGSQRGALVRFSQVRRSNALSGEWEGDGLEFAGYISEDGMIIRGSWRETPSAGVSGRKVGGSWIAQRE